MIRPLRVAACRGSFLAVVTLTAFFSEAQEKSSLASSEGSETGRTPDVNARALSKAERRAGQAYDSGCPQVCAAHEACVMQRCVTMCRPACREGTICSPSGTCEPLPEMKEPVLTEAERQRLSGLASRDARTLIFVDMGGVVGYGARPGIEHGEFDSFILRLHLLNTGILSHAVFVENENERFEWGFGASAGYRHYQSSWGNLRGFYLGVGIDYSISRIVSRGANDLAQLRQTAAPYGEFGYRWVFGNFALAFGPTLALRYPIFVGTLGSDRELCRTEFDCQEASRRLEGTVNIELGWFQ